MRYDLQSQSRTADVPNGDLGFLGLRMKTPREQLTAGYYPRAENKRIGAGLETRPGTRTPVFANEFAGGPLIGSGPYSNPNGEELGLLFLKNKVYGIRAGTLPITIPVTQNFGNGATVDITQHFDKVLAHQSDPSFPTLVWDGIDLTDGFTTMPSPSVTGLGFLNMPNPAWSINFLDRAWFPIPDEPDSIGATDENDVFTWDSIKHKFRVNTGTADQLIGAHPFFDSSLLIAKRRSIDILKDIPQDLGDSFLDGQLPGATPISSAPPPRVGVVSDEIGSVARKAGILAGGTFMFLSDSGPCGGIYRVITDAHGRYIVDVVPVSEEIEPLIQRINWPYAGNSIAVLHGRYAIWMVPMDGATFNNAALILNLATNEWESVDFWNISPRRDQHGRLLTFDNPMRMDSVFHLGFYGSAQLFAADHNQAWVRLLYKGLDDQFETAGGTPASEKKTVPIQDVMETRGYSITSATSETNQRSNYAAFGLATLAPTITFTQLVDGADGDEIQIGAPSPTVPDRQKYTTGRADYVLSNVNDDADDVDREDYSVQMGDDLLLNDDGVRPRRVWPWEEKIVLNSEGRFVSYRISNTGGISQVRSVLHEAEKTRKDRKG